LRLRAIGVTRLARARRHRKIVEVKVAIVAAEIGPHAKAGGLADVIGALPQALNGCGAEACVILPAYKMLLEEIEAKPHIDGLSIRLGPASETFRILRAATASGVPLYLIDHPEFFGREGIYGEHGSEYPDNLRRYIFFARAAAAAAATLDPDVVHAHDWHAAALPILMRADPALRERFAATAAAFTIHNAEFQGRFDARDFPLLGLDPSWYATEWLEFYGDINLMKGAVVLADGVSTVSPSYAAEIAHDPKVAFGLEGVFRAKGDRLIGILNGADYDEWDPASDLWIAERYSPQRREGKHRCRNALCEEFNLPRRPATPVVGIVSRMTWQKGLDLLADALDEVVALDVQIVMLASGDAKLESFFLDAQRRYPESLRLIAAMDNRLAHRIQAGSDIFLMPSRFEPCGLTQMYALKYGTPPIVHATGGLKDTVTEFDAAGSGDGFVFGEFRSALLVDALRRAVRTFREPQRWHQLMANCFAANFSWAGAARQYLDWFERMRRARVSA
jgi:starch synthase